MKKDTIAKLQLIGKRKRSGKGKGKGKGKGNQIRGAAASPRLTVGLDVGDRSSRYCILDEAGVTVSEDQLATTKAGLESLFGKLAPCRIALEVGTHSSWISRHLAGMGHEVIVANAREVKLITQSVKKSDRMDAEQLARLARADPKLLSPIRHRGEEAQGDLAVIRGRMALVDARTKLINCARGLAKPMGERLQQCDADQVKEALAEGLGERVQKAIRPLLKGVEQISQLIAACDQEIAGIEKRYPEVKLLKAVWGVGTLIGLTYILTIEDAQRFEHSRDVGPYLGLTRKRRDSGDREPELGISKAGDKLLRRLLVQGAQCIMRRDAPDCDLKAWGIAKLQNGGHKGSQKVSKRAKKKTIVAIARKLAVLLHRLWVTGEAYDPHYNRKAAEAAKSKARNKAQAAA